MTVNEEHGSCGATVSGVAPGRAALRHTERGAADTLATARDASVGWSHGLLEARSPRELIQLAAGRSWRWFGPRGGPGVVVHHAEAAVLPDEAIRGHERASRQALQASHEGCLPEQVRHRAGAGDGRRAAAQDAPPALHHAVAADQGFPSRVHAGDGSAP